MSKVNLRNDVNEDDTYYLDAFPTTAVSPGWLGVCLCRYLHPRNGFVSKIKLTFFTVVLH